MDIPTTCIVTWVEEKAQGGAQGLAGSRHPGGCRSMQKQGVVLLALRMKWSTPEEHARGAG
jgi:hypothetical protein